MMSGTSKIWSKSGPVSLRIITKMLQQIQENYGFVLGKYDLCQYGIQKKRFFKKKNVCPRYHMFRFCFLFLCGILNIYIYIYVLKYFCGDEDREMINFPLIKFTKAWMRVSYLSRNMNRKFDIFIFR